MQDLHFASALSTLSDSGAAIDEVVAAIHAGLAGRTPDLLAVFVSHHHGPAIESLGPNLARMTSARVVVGCTGEGVVGGGREIERGAALSVFAAVLPDTQLTTFEVAAHVQPDETMRFTTTPVIRDAKRASLLLFADPYTFPMGDYLELLNREHPGVAAVGGMASGGEGPGQNLLVTNRGVTEGGALGLVVEGATEIASVVSQGCRPIGKPFVITACKEHFIQKLGGKPAAQALMEMMQELETNERARLQRGPFIGLAIDARKSTFERHDFLARPLHGLDPKQGSLVVGDNSIRVGQTIQFLVRDRESAGEDLVHMLQAENDSAVPDASAAMGALIFSCNGRGTQMFGKPDHDITCLQSAFARELPAAGFLAMGEIGPVGGKNFLHGFTASVALFRKRAGGA
ncbi:MAG: FIST N-terminal domain-containing protein [Planctomycetota bacterium]